MAKCSVCGTELEKGQKFCFECGAPVPQTKKCIKCGIELPLKMKFCPECGTKQDGTVNAFGSGFSMGDKNVIAGDVIGHKEETHIAGNATIIKNEDETKKTAKCHICGSIVKIVDGFDCPECGQFTCENCYDEKDGCCTECAEKHGEQKINRYKEALKMILADGRIEFSERKELISLQQELGISAEKAKQLEEELKKAALGTGSEITTFEKVSLDKATNLFYKEGNVKEALNLLEPVYKAHKNDEKVLDVYLPVLAEVAPLEAQKIINGLQIDILMAFVVAIGINIKQKNLVEAEKCLNQALRIWHESTLLKCYNVLFNYAMYIAFEDSSFLEKARNLSEQLGEAQSELELSFQVKIQAMLQEEVGESVVSFDKDFCEQNHLYWQVMNNSLLKSIDKNCVTVGNDDNADFRTIQKALDYVNEDATVHILPGIYEEHLVFKKTVKLIGCKESIKNKGATELPIIVFNSEKTCEIDVNIEIEGIIFTHEKQLRFSKLEQFISEDIEFDRSNYDINKHYKVVKNCCIDFHYGESEFKSLFLINTNSKITNVAIISAAYHALTVNNAYASIKESIFFHITDYAIQFINDSKGIIDNCIINNCNHDNMCIENISKVEISRTVFSGSGDFIRMKNSSCVTFEKCNFKDTVVWIFDNANPLIKNCEFDDSSLYICRNAKGKYINCNFHNVVYKNVITVKDDANPDIENCEISCLHERGDFDYAVVIIEGNSSGIYRGCIIHDVEDRFGIVIKENASPLIENCIIYNMKGCAYAGICINGEADPIIKNCEIHDNFEQICEDYEILDNGITGIKMCDDAKPSIENCEIYNNSRNGICCYDSSSPRITDCRIHDNKAEGHNYPGIVCSDNSNPTISNCEIYGHLSHGIWIKAQASGTYENCDIHDNKAAAISNQSSNKIDFSSCRCRNNG